MKGIDIFCASQAATAICLSMEQGSTSSPFSSSSSSAILLSGEGGGRAIDRHNPIIKDSRRIIAKSLPPCTTTSQPPLSPKPHHQKLHHHNKKKNKKKIPPYKENDEKNPEKILSGSSSSLTDDEKIIKNINGSDNSTVIVKKSGWSCTKPGDFISPPGSTRYLLRDNNKVSFNSLSVDETSEAKDAKTEELFDAKLPSSSPSPDQVVVLRVSLHCRGCEKKLRKHLSRMEGVTSFDIDFKAKKVTVSGKVTPVGVLSSISKVKNAQLWSPMISSSIPPSNNNHLTNSESKSDFKEAGA